MTDIDITKLRSLASAATPGPWKLVNHNGGGLPSGYEDWSIVPVNGCAVAIEALKAPGVATAAWWNEKVGSNAAYIASANPQTMLALLDRIAELERTAAAAGAALADANRQVAELTADAERYRWLREHFVAEPSVGGLIEMAFEEVLVVKASESAAWPNNVDAAIDARKEAK